MIDGVDTSLEKRELWRRQCAKNLMDCYQLGMEAAATVRTAEGRKALDSLIKLMVDGMTGGREAEDERAFYRKAAASCHECREKCGDSSGIFRIYAAIFEDIGGREGGHE